MPTYSVPGDGNDPWPARSSTVRRPGWPSASGLAAILALFLAATAGAAVPRVWLTFSRNAAEPAGRGMVLVYSDTTVTEPLTVYYQILGGTNTTATSGVDFEPMPGSVVITPEMRWTGFIEIIALDDLVAEGAEKLTISLIPNPAYYTTVLTNMVVWLADDETPPPAPSSWFVATNGTDLNPGTLAQPFATVRKALTVSRYGDTIYLRGGIYRQGIHAQPDSGRLSLLETSAANSNNVLTIRNYSNEVAVVTGSDPVTGWATTTGPVPGVTYWRARWTNLSQQVFFNSQRLGQIGWTVPLSLYPYSSDPVANSNALLRVTNSAGISVLHQGLAQMTNWAFYHDTNDNWLYLGLPAGQDPSLGLVEASTRSLAGLFYSHVTLQGLIFRHSHNLAVNGGFPGVALGAFCTVDRCTIEWCDFMGLSAWDSSRFLNCTVQNNGMMGGIIWGTNMLVANCRFLTNHYLPFDLRGEAAGMKVIGQPELLDNTLWRDNEFAYNLGEGLWLDTMTVRDRDTAPCTIRNNYCHDNRGSGIMIEFTRGTWVLNNLSVRNKSKALYFSQSAYGWVFNNTLLAPEGSVTAVEVTGGYGGFIAWHPHDIWFYNNVIGTDDLTVTPGPTDYQTVVFQKVGNCTGATNLYFDYNCYLVRGTRAAGDYFYFNNLDNVNGFTGPNCSTEPGWFRTNFAGWQSRGFDTHGYVLTNLAAIDQFFLAATGGNYRITADSPAAGTGVNAFDYYQHDLAGRLRPAVAGFSIGAYEYVDTVRVTAPDSTAEETGGNLGQFLITRTALDISMPMTVPYSLSGTATAGIDYQAGSGSVTIPAGATSVVQNVTGLVDALSEATETVILTLTGTTNYTVSGLSSSATVQLLDSPPPPLPGTPSNVVATPGNRRVELQWTAAPHATSYRVTRATATGGPYALVASPTGTNYTNLNLKNGTTYYFRISGVNVTGQGPASATVSATPAR